MPHAVARSARAEDLEPIAPPPRVARPPRAQPRRTVKITGRPAEGARTARVVEIDRRRPPRPVRERAARRPDRIALWALGMAVLLALAAATSSDAATRFGQRTLKEGMSGADVRVLQVKLRRLRILSGAADGRFGPMTERAVRRYQWSRCLTVDGVAGPRTLRALRFGRRRCRGSGSRTTRRTTRPQRYLYVELGARPLRRGARGRDVRTVQRLLSVPPTGYFGPLTSRRVRRFQSRVGLRADGVVGAGTRRFLIGRRMGGRTATWYGPGLYGRRTACGQTLTTRLRGVAHRSLPCGRKVLLYHRGRWAFVRVVDRGPFVRGITLDLTAATARSLGMSGTARIRARY